MNQWGGGSTDAAHPTTRGTFNCEFPGCRESFTTTIGRGLHHRSAHPAWYDERNVTTKMRARWTEEESQLLARREAELTSTGVRFINQALLESFPERTIGAIKGKRSQQRYKDLVKRLVEEHRTSITASPEATSPPCRRAHCHRPGEGAKRLLLYIRSLRPLPSTTEYQAGRLQDIIDVATNTEDREAVFQSLSLYLRDVLRPTTPQAAPLVHHRLPTSRKQLRRREYAETQRHWKKCRTRCIRSILDRKEDTQQPPRERMETYWTTVFTQKANDIKPKLQERQTLEDIWDPITLEDIKACQPPMATSPGADGLTARQMRAIPSHIIVRILNLILWCGRIPDHLSLSSRPSSSLRRHTADSLEIFDQSLSPQC